MKLLRILTALASSALLSTAVHAATYDHLGIQTWSLKDNTKENGFLSSLDLIAHWGIPEVEGSVMTPGFTSEQVLTALRERGLTMPSAHDGYEAIDKDLDAQVKAAKELGLKYVICPWIPHEGEFNRETMEKAVAVFNRAGAAFRAAGIKFGYHPHGYEFVPNGTPGETLCDDLIRACNKDDVCFEMDVFWTINGGADPVTLLNRYPGRWMGLHVKDMRKGAKTGDHTAHQPVEDNVAVGSGMVDWKAVLSTAKKVGADYFIIEDETSDPLTNIPLSLDYLRKLEF